MHVILVFLCYTFLINSNFQPHKQLTLSAPAFSINPHDHHRYISLRSGRTQGMDSIRTKPKIYIIIYDPTNNFMQNHLLWQNYPASWLSVIIKRAKFNEMLLWPFISMVASTHVFNFLQDYDHIVYIFIHMRRSPVGPIKKQVEGTCLFMAIEL